MCKVSLICHSVVVLATLFSIRATADTVSRGACVHFFETASPQDIAFSSSEKTMSELKTAYLEILKKDNPKTEHQPYFASQVPQVLRMLTAKFYNSLIDFNRIKSEQAFTNSPIYKSKMAFEAKLKDSYKLLVSDAKQKIENRAVTYEWYMDFFLKAIILSDVTARISDFNQSRESFEILSKKVDIILGRINTIYLSDNRALKLYSSLGMQFSKMTKDRYFTKYSSKTPVIPVLFIPKPEDIIAAEKMGFYFVSLNQAKANTTEGEKYPLEFAGLQMDENLSRIHKTANAIRVQDKVKSKNSYKNMLDLILKREMMRGY